MLTQQLHKLLVLIDERIAKDAVCPSYGELMVGMGLHSKSGIARMVDALVERGFLRRLPFRGRALEVVRRPGDLKSDRKIEGSNFDIDGVCALQTSVKTLPLMSEIRVDEKGGVCETSIGHISVPGAFIGEGEYFGFVVNDDGYEGEGIFRNDIAIARRVTSAGPADLVVASVGHEKASLMRYPRPKTNGVGSGVGASLGNPVHVHGRVVSLTRSY